LPIQASAEQILRRSRVPFIFLSPLLLQSSYSSP
jgi:hypothetical protein